MSESAVAQAARSAITSQNPLLALVGNPNTGKTTVFNALCGSRQRVGNYPGVTVDRKSGVFELGDGRTAELVDLPGLYSLRPASPDEEIAANLLMGRPQGPRPDLVLFVLDATNLKRNLFLYSQVVEMGLPVAVVLTMTDLLEDRGIQLDVAALARSLDAPVFPLVGRESAQLTALLAGTRAILAEPHAPRVRVGFPQSLEGEAVALETALEPLVPLGRFEAADLLFNAHHYLWPLIEQNSAARQLVLEHRERVLKEGIHNPASIAVARYRWIDSVLQTVEERTAPTKADWSARADRILTHRIFGFLAFAGIMLGVFQAIYSWSAPLMDGVEFSMEFLGEYAGLLLADLPALRSLVVDGIIAGVGSVLVFLPQIFILFALVAFLEDSGYLARAAFLMDRLLGWTGLNGRAFIPLLSSFACAVPGVMSARVMPDPRARMATVLVAPLMSCSARLPVYLLLIGAFIEPRFGTTAAVLALFGMHALGLVVAMPVAFFLNRGVLRTPPMAFLLEIPPYRRPRLYNVFFRAYEAGKKFLIQAGTIIFVLSILIWAMSYFPRPDSVGAQIESRYQPLIEEARDAEVAPDLLTELEARRDHEIAGAYLAQSILGRLGHAVQPVFEPLGFNWKITVGILGAFPAREVIISTLGIIYNVGEVDEESVSLRERLQADQRPDGSAVFTPLVAVTLMVFFALCSQCMSTLATVRRELNSTRWAVFLFIYMTALAYIFGLVIYQGGLLLGLS
ncbi:MAG: ferrous iron transport protein B [Spirochaetales bacterium]|nr:ferrous iron transport protein B [Spirochaetales bacterium]MCP5485875.1 ferrous iron transport protein B [Spirochaetales bacterium]